MKSDQDAFGKYILAQYEAILKGQPITAEIVERDDNYIDFGSMSGMYLRPYKWWDKLEQQMVDRARGKILDIGCGAGRHSLYLQEKGFDVTGIDNSAGAIDVCRLRGLEHAFVRSVYEIDKFELNSFDTILMLGNNFGLFGDAENGKVILHKIHRITKENAQIIVETLNPYMTDDETHLKYHKLNIERRRMVGQIRLRIRYGNTVGEWFDYLFVSPEEMEGIINDTNWQIKEFINSDKANYFAVIEKKLS